MAENVYEGMFILDANRYARDAAGVTRHVEQLIEKAGGHLLVSRLWEERRLAYPIQRHRKGAYWLTYFRLEPDRLGGLSRQSLISDLVLRHLFLKVDPRIVETVVSHVQAQGKPAAAGPQTVASGAAAERPKEATTAPP